MIAGRLFLDGKMSPLAEGRELKFCHAHIVNYSARSPLAEGRELK